VQRPADVSRKLLRLGSGQQHTEIKRVQETRLVDPLLLVDQHAVHHGDLPGRPAEIDAADLEPDPECLAECWRGVRVRGDRFCLHGHFRLTP
jgi:hypothetical protein